MFADIEATLHNLASDLGADTVVEIVDLYVADAPENVSAMRQAFASGDVDTLRRASHTLKSTAATIGAMALADLCKAVETLARENRLAETGAQLEQIGRLEAESRLALQTLRPKLAELIES